MRVTVGIDPGLTTTGVVIVDSDNISGAAVFRSPPPAKGQDIYRINILARQVIGYIDYMLAGKEVMFAIENNYLTARQSAVKQTMLIGVLSDEAERRQWEIVSIAPTSAKKALTGNGRAEKQDMVAEFTRRSGLENGPKFKLEALADAYGVALAAIARK